MEMRYTSAGVIDLLSDVDRKVLGVNASKAVFETMLGELVKEVYGGVLDKVQARRVARILHAIDMSDNMAVELDESDVYFVREIFNSEKVKVPFNQAQIYVVLSELVNNG